MSDWISVDDRLPESSKEFNCHYNGQVFSAVFDKDHDKWFVPSVGANRVSYYIEVSHWKPLPKPPKDE